MEKLWFVGVATRKGMVRVDDQDKIGFQVAAALFASSRYGYTVYVPLRPLYDHEGSDVVDMLPRFGSYLFLSFDRNDGNWGNLVRGEQHIKYFERILCDNNVPTPVPERVMTSIRSFKPMPAVQAAPIVFSPGQQVAWYIGHKRMTGVFVADAGKHNAEVDCWMFGRQTVTKVNKADLEPLDVDTTQSSAA